MAQAIGKASVYCALAGGIAQGLASSLVSGPRQPQDMEGLPIVLGLMTLWAVIAICVALGLVTGLAGLRDDDSRPWAILGLVLNLTVAGVTANRWLGPDARRKPAAARTLGKPRLVLVRTEDQALR